jgi:hypothetical protein
VPRSTKYGSLYPLPHTPSWCIVKHRENFTFSYLILYQF